MAIRQTRFAPGDSNSDRDTQEQWVKIAGSWLCKGIDFPDMVDMESDTGFLRGELLEQFTGGVHPLYHDRPISLSPQDDSDGQVGKGGGRIRFKGVLFEDDAPLEVVRRAMIRHKCRRALFSETLAFCKKYPKEFWPDHIICCTGSYMQTYPQIGYEAGTYFCPLVIAQADSGLRLSLGLQEAWGYRPVYLCGPGDPWIRGVRCYLGVQL